MASRLVTGSIVLLLAGTASCGVYVLLSNAAYLRSSAPVISSAKSETMSVIKLPSQPITDPAGLAAQHLTAHADTLISWPGKLGQMSGTYWAAASTVGNTKAPQGPRVFIRTDNKVAVTLPEPPYNADVQRAINSFSGK